MKNYRFEALRRRLGAKLGVVTALVGSARQGKRGADRSNSPREATSRVYAAGIRVNPASSLPESASSLAGRVAHVSSPAGLWACSGGSWC